MNHGSMWRIAADTGGTFTDAFALSPEGVETRCKVLSSGLLRVRVTAITEASDWLVEGMPDMPDGFFENFLAAF